MHLFIDTETTSLPDFKLPANHPAQPHIVSLAAWLGEWRDDDMTHIASLNAVIKPDGYTFDERAVAVHGITEQYARALGEPADVVLIRFFTLVEQALASLDEDTPLFVAHNFSFDHRMLLREMSHIGMDSTSLGLLRPFCTMKALTPRMKLPHPRGRPRPGVADYKWPKLDEAYAYVFDGATVPGREDGTHGAMVDTLAAKDIYCEGRRRGWWP